MTRRTGAPRRTRRRSLLRYLGDTFLTAGIARGVSHGGDRGRSADHMLARGALFDEGRRSYDDERPPGLLERVPGWLVLAGVAALILAVYLFR